MALSEEQMKASKTLANQIADSIAECRAASEAYRATSKPEPKPAAVMEPMASVYTSPKFKAFLKGLVLEVLADVERERGGWGTHEKRADFHPIPAPTEPGWWWCSPLPHQPAEEPRIYHVHKNEKTGVLFISDGLTNYSVTPFGQWYGPRIPEPEIEP